MIQLRISEMFNHLAMFNKRYIFAVTLGVFISNLYSPLGIYDLFFGTAETLILTISIYLISPRIKSNIGKYAMNILLAAIFMSIIAFELMLVTKAPFWLTYLTTAIGEAISMTIGAFIINALSKIVNFN